MKNHGPARGADFRLDTVPPFDRLAFVARNERAMEFLRDYAKTNAQPILAARNAFAVNAIDVFRTAETFWAHGYTVEGQS